MELKELTLEEQKEINGGALLLWAAMLGLYMGYKEMEREVAK
ncbi:hypothetical protein HNP37_000737 [Flavobacterium nitrogenifigens]|uniref:Class IIb bacteriocin, lactobin A/cerein 7B family n=2 Tax=Flavobacterium TaxID=237 RepID=A0A7W7IUS2_9FLAO|nr:MULTISPECIES: hypothetical protein [Flavobacterium]MBB4800698.1 hypothetical protein [Flavobacterium nitrogenifigens]MBB6385555.1 hypothetical protein [Flavobacterium notoginsengisoli]